MCGTEHRLVTVAGGGGGAENGILDVLLSFGGLKSQ